MERLISLPRPQVVCSRHPLLASRFLRARFQEHGPLLSLRRPGVDHAVAWPQVKRSALIVHCRCDFIEGNRGPTSGGNWPKVTS